jgi:predicted dehydrogenase
LHIVKQDVQHVKHIRTLPLQWGVIGTGGIAADFCQALIGSTRCRVINVVGTSPHKASAFATRFGVSAWSEDLAQLLSDPAVSAVYVASPHTCHDPHAMACIEAGKAVLCEKPITVDAAGAERLVAAARNRDAFLMEAFMYRCHPLLRELVRRLQDDVLGRITHVRAQFGFRAPRVPTHRLFDPGLGGGSILDVGGYPISFARLIAGIAEGLPFAEPVLTSADGVIGPTGVDELAHALLTFQSGMTANVTSAIHEDVGTGTVVFGEKGKIVLPNPWIPRGSRQGTISDMIVCRDGHDPEDVAIRTDLPTYAIEAELVAESLPGIEAQWPAMSHADTVGNMRVLDAWRAALRDGLAR